MKRYFIKSIAALSLIFALAACAKESKQETAVGTPARIVGSIGTAEIESRALLRSDDNISYSAFQAGDKIGFFSNGGLKAENEPLTYNSGSFLGSDGNDAFIWTEGTATSVYAFFPYKLASTPSANNYQISIWRDAVSGSWVDGFEDVLVASTSSVANGALISLPFGHHFSMLIIERGAGFDTGTGNISIQLNQKISKEALIVRGSSTSMRLLSDNTAGVQEVAGNPGTYKPSGSTGPGNDCYYVIIPVGNVYEGTTNKGALSAVTVTLTDNSGQTRQVSLPAQTLASNWKYRYVVTMRNNIAVIEPEEIIRWNDVDIHIEKPAGIENSADFEIWMSTYNAANPDRSTILSKYGTYSSGKWTFLILDDIDLSQLTGERTAVITSFSDILDGQGHTLKGLTLNGDTNVGFFGTLTGSVSNMKLEDIVVSKKTDSGSNFGGIAGTLSSGSISNCHIIGLNSFILGKANTGGLVGLQTGGTIANCSSSAMVSGNTGSTGLLIGTGGGSETNCKSTGTIINN